MARLKDTRKRQTRLALTPLPSSSPAAKGYNQQIQDRAAAVSLESPAKRRKVEDDDSGNVLGGAQLDGLNDSIPTPAASLEQGIRNEADSYSDSEPFTSTQRRPNTQNRLTSRTRSGQQQLDFSRARDPDTFSSPLKLSSSAKPHSSARAGIFGTQRQGAAVNISSDEAEEDLPSSGKLMAKRKSKMAGKIGGGSARITRSTQQPVLVESESEGDYVVVGGKQQNPIEVSEDEDDDEEMPTTTGIQRRRRGRRASRNSFISSSPPKAISDDDDDELEIIERSKRRRRRDETDDDEDESEDEPKTPGRRNLKRPRQSNRKEKEELDEDLEFLGPSSDIETSARKPRNTQTAQKSARQKALESLKRRRSGQLTEEEQEVNKGDDDDDDDDDGDQDDFNVQSDDEEEQRPPISSRQMFAEDEYDDEFVEEEDDDQNLLGVPAGVPLEFTRYASMKPKELFKYAVEWMVQKKINPAFQMNDGIYDLTFRKLDDEVKGLAGSKFKSAAWTLPFTMALNARPDIAYEHIDRSEAEHFMRDTCDACNRTNHPATYQIQFQGRPYHPESLEEVAGNEDDEDDDSSTARESDDPDYDYQGREISPVNKIYYVGKFCMGNAQTAHALQHWRYHLNEWVVTWLIANGYNTPEKIVKRDQWSTKKRRKFANKIVDRMEQEGVVKTLWQDFRKNIDEARNSKQGRYSGWSP